MKTSIFSKVNDMNERKQQNKPTTTTPHIKNVVRGRVRVRVHQVKWVFRNHRRREHDPIELSISTNRIYQHHTQIRHSMLNIYIQMRKKNNERETVSITNKFHLMETATVRCSNWLSSFENFSCIHHFHQILSPLYVTIYIYMPSLTTYTSPIEHILCEMKVLRAQTIKRIF